MAMNMQAKDLKSVFVIVKKTWSGPRRTPARTPINASIDNNTLRIEFINETAQNVTLKIADMNGNSIYEEHLSVAPQEPYDINLNGYENGTYRLYYQDENTEAIGDFEIE